MRIALVGPAHPYKGGGAQHTTELAHRLTAAGHDVVIESWRAQYPASLYPGQPTVTEPEGVPFPRTRRALAWYRPDGWLTEGRRLARADLVVFALITPLQIPAYLAMLGAIKHGAIQRHPKHPRTAVICHNVLPHERRPGDVALTTALLTRVDEVIVHSAAQAAQARELAPDVPITAVRLPAHLPAAASPHNPERAAITFPRDCRLLFAVQRLHHAIHGFVGSGLDRDTHAHADSRVARHRARRDTRHRAGRRAYRRAPGERNATRGDAGREYQTEARPHCSAPQRGVAGSADAHFHWLPSRHTDAT